MGLPTSLSNDSENEKEKESKCGKVLNNEC